MDIKAILVIILIIVGLIIVFNFFGCTRSKTETINHPPFTIKKKNRYGKRYDINTASRVNNSRSNYSLYYKDQLITFPEALNKNTGVHGLWKAYVLKDAPQPALIAGSKSVYLITEADQKYKMTTLNQGGSDFASFQWLDNVNGQPGSKQELYSSDDTGSDCQLEGGRFLVINKKLILDVNDLSIFPFKVDYNLTDNFSTNNIIAFSPDNDKIVFMGSKYEREYSYALMVHNFKTNETQIIPFDRTATRLHEPFDLHTDWFSTYFNWVQKADNSFELEKISLETPHNWEGHFGRSGNFSVSPTKEDMLDILGAFTKDYLQLSDSEVKVAMYGGNKEYGFTLGQSRAEISYQESRGSVYFSNHFTNKGEDEEACRRIIKKVGEAFNEKLRDGEHQDLFTSY